MGIEDEIRSFLTKGYNPLQIIREFRYKKSTVYKVYNEQKLTTNLVRPSLWSADGITFDRGIDDRYLPGDSATIGFNLMNQSPSDLYVARAGIQPEWQQMYLGTRSSEWTVQEGTFLLRPGERRPFRLRIGVPNDLTLGEYDLRFGIEGHFVSMEIPQYGSSSPISWTDPIIFRVQYPMSHTVFLSHSTSNMSLVRQLDNSLENFGVHCIIAEDISEPGRDLHDKFYHYIDTSSFFVGLITREAVMSQMVIDEVNHALTSGKPGIYLIEDGTEIQLPVEWASKFSRDWPVEQFVGKVLEAIENIRKRGMIQSNNFPSGAVIAGLAAFFFGLAAGKSSKER